MEKDKLAQLAKDIAMDKVFTSHHIRKEEFDIIGSVFMPIGLGCLNGKQEEYSNLGFIYEYLSEAGPRSINGFPIFMSCKYVNQEDAKRIFGLVEKINESINLITE